MKNILIIRFSALGDIVLTTPVISTLRQSHPEAKIVYATKEAFADILPDVVSLELLKKDDNLAAYAKRLSQQGPFDLVVDLHASLRSRLLCLRLRYKKLRRFRKPYIKRWLTIRTKHNFLTKTPSVVERYLATVKEFSTSHETRPIVNRAPLPKQLQKKLIRKKYFVIAPGSRWFTKKWPREYFAQTAIQLLKHYPTSQLVLLGGSDEVEDCDSILAKLPKGRAMSVAGGLSLSQAAQLLSGAEFLLCNDSGLMHIAAAFEHPIYALFLSTIPEFGFSPPSEHAVILMAADIPCRPCTHKGLPSCPKKHFRCAHELTPAQVVKAICQ